MDMKRFFLYAIAIAALALAGCGGSGSTMVEMDTETPPVTTTPPAPPDEDDMDKETATGFTEHEMAFVRGIVNPRVADDPTTSRPTDHNSRPGQTAGEELGVVAGGMADTTGDNTPKTHLPKTSIGTSQLGEPDSPWKTVGSEKDLGTFVTQTYERTVRGVTDTVNLYSNIDDPKAVPYLTYYASGTAANRPGLASATAAGVLTFEVEGAFDTDYGSLFEASAFPTDDKDDKVYPDADAKAFDGSFNGIAGKFTCGSAGAGDCTATANKKGVLATLVGEWTFKPDGDAKDIKVADASYDADYLSFGYWISENTTASGSRFEVGTMYDGSQPFLNSSILVLRGNATYVGEAAGAYARKGENPAAGEFTGHASLTASFAAGDPTISGSISRMVDGGTEIDPTWTVELQKATVEATGDQATFDGATPRGGNWRGGFFGTPAEATGDAAERYPLGAAGDFTGHFENGHVIGAFGATRR
jgi:hypothetical protein